MQYDRQLFLFLLAAVPMAVCFACHEVIAAVRKWYNVGRPVGSVQKHLISVVRFYGL